MSLTEVKLRPTGPWRVGDRAGDRERVDVVYHSDALYSAVTHAMRALGWMEEWLDATARSTGAPAVRFSSLFPFIGKTRLVSPPKSVWPPVIPGKLYLQGARLVPLDIVKSGVVEESRWQVDGESACLVPLGGSAPFRVSMRAAAAVDRLTGVAESHRTACLEFASNAGWWGVFEAANATWEARVKSALRLLADSGFGGERSRGWGRASEPYFSDAGNLFARNGVNGTWWLLSLYSPHESDVVDWARGEYSAAVRGGWTDSTAGTGAKKQVRMIEEGSVLSSPALRGQAVDVAPEGFAHPVYRSGFALAMPAPVEIVVRSTESGRPQRVVAEEPVKEEPVVVPEPEAAAAPDAEKPMTIGEPVDAVAAVDALVAEEPPITPGDDSSNVVPVETEPEEVSVPDAEKSMVISEPVEFVGAVDTFVAEEPLVTPGDDAASVVREDEAEGELPVFAGEPEVVAPPAVVPEPFDASEPAGASESVTAVVPEPVAPEEVAPEAADAAAGSFVAEEPLVTPGDQAISAHEPGEPDAVAPPLFVKPEDEVSE